MKKSVIFFSLLFLPALASAGISCSLNSSITHKCTFYASGISNLCQHVLTQYSPGALAPAVINLNKTVTSFNIYTEKKGGYRVYHGYRTNSQNGCSVTVYGHGVTSFFR